jgi:hypothetical protein
MKVFWLIAGSCLAPPTSFKGVVGVLPELRTLVPVWLDRTRPVPTVWKLLLVPGIRVIPGYPPEHSGTSEIWEVGKAANCVAFCLFLQWSIRVHIRRSRVSRFPYSSCGKEETDDDNASSQYFATFNQYHNLTFESALAYNALSNSRVETGNLLSRLCFWMSLALQKSV